MWTKESMGWTMKGMTPSPIPVVAHFLVFSATDGIALASPRRDPAQIRLIRKPESMRGILQGFDNIWLLSWLIIVMNALKINVHVWDMRWEATWNNDRGEGLPYESVESRKGDFPRVWIWHLNRKETSHHMTGSCKSQNQSSYFIHFLPLIRSICQHVGTCHPIARSHPSRQDISTSTHLLSDLAMRM